MTGALERQIDAIILLRNKKTGSALHYLRGYMAKL